MPLNDNVIFLCAKIGNVLENAVQIDEQKTEINLDLIVSHIAICQECKDKIFAYMETQKIPLYLKPLINHILS